MSDARLRYSEDLRWVLEGVNLDLGPGSRTAVVGRSGTGKTSLLNALLRYWPLGGGSYTVDGTDATKLRQDDVRSRYALLDQDADLFAGSIRDNVALADPEASDARVRRVVELAQLAQWVDALPEGLDTPVGEHGTKVSGGQRQRIAMARAMLRSVPILLLDEPTAGLDRETAERLLDDLRSSFPAEAILLVTHRREELAGFDRVLTMRDGRLVEDAPVPAPLPATPARSERVVSPPGATDRNACPPEVRVALRELADRYALHVDRLEIDEIGRLFVPDGVLKVPIAPGAARQPQPRRGREEICKAMGSLDRYEATFHATMGHVVEHYAESGSARGVTTCLAHHLTVGEDRAAERERAVDYVMAIRYLDTYTLFEGSWHFAERELTVSWLADWPVTRVRTRSGEWRPAAP